MKLKKLKKPELSESEYHNKRIADLLPKHIVPCQDAPRRFSTGHIIEFATPVSIVFTRIIAVEPDAYYIQLDRNLIRVPYQLIDLIAV